ncbi:MAG: transposase [Pseudomonadota bacterium]|nr:transposase [Pseudomonadota bacterium]
MTLGERLIDRGHQKGLQEGLFKGKLEVAQRLLAEGLDPTFVARITGIPLDEIKALEPNVTEC